jgi:hypothetical protein
MFITANQPLDCVDTSDAIRRRLLFFPAKGRVAKSDMKNWVRKEPFRRSHLGRLG